MTRPDPIDALVSMLRRRSVEATSGFPRLSAEELTRLLDEVDRLRTTGDREHLTDGDDCWCNPKVTLVGSVNTTPARCHKWRHAHDCPVAASIDRGMYCGPCNCGLSELKTKIDAKEYALVSPTGHVGARYNGREEWWLTLIAKAEADESAWSGDVPPSSVAVAERLLGMTEGA